MHSNPSPFWLGSLRESLSSPPSVVTSSLESLSGSVLPPLYASLEEAFATYDETIQKRIGNLESKMSTYPRAPEVDYFDSLLGSFNHVHFQKEFGQRLSSGDPSTALPRVEASVTHGEKYGSGESD
jgi:hypothetical protein